MQLALSLQEALPAELHRLLLVFCRISAAFLLLPGFGEGGVPVRVRVLAALGAALCIAPLAGPAVPAPGTWQTTAMVAAETISGVLIGTMARLVIAAVQTAGQVIGNCIGLGNVFTGGLGPDSSGTLGAAIQVGSLAALFAIGGHHAALRALAESYDLLALGQMPAPDFSADLLARGVARSFALGVQLSLPFLLLGLLANLAMAFVNRAMPAMPVFMIGMPALLLAGLYLFWLTAPALVGEALAAFAQSFRLR